MVVGALKASPVAALLGVASIRDLAAYMGIATMLASILVVGALISAAKAWRERAEARTDEALQLEKERREDREKIANLEGQVTELSRRPDLRAIRNADADEHRAIVAAVDRLSGQFAAALERNTAALETLAKHVPWGDLIERRTPE